MEKILSRKIRPDIRLRDSKTTPENNILKRNLSNSSNDGKAFIKLDILFDWSCLSFIFKTRAWVAPIPKTEYEIKDAIIWPIIKLLSLITNCVSEL